MILLARLFPGPNNGMAYALAPVEDSYKVVPTWDPFADARRLEEKGEKVVVLYSISTPAFVEYWREIAEVSKRYPVIAGGPHASGDPITLLKLGVKYVVVGDGEAALPEILAHLEGELDRAPVNTLLLEGGRLRAGPRVYVELTHKTYSETLGIYPPVEIMRSCTHRCVFCQTWGHGPVRFRPVHNVADVAKVYVSRGVRDIRFVAPVGFLYGSADGKTPNVDALTALLKAVREAGGRPYLGTFPSETRPETVTEEVLRAIKPLVTNRRISFGLQTASVKMLNLTKRGHGVEEVEQAVRVSLKMGFRPVVDVIGGLPGEAEEDVAETIKAMEKLVALGAYIRMHYFIPLPGTPLWMKKPAPPSPLYERFIRRYKRKVEGYWEEQIQLAEKIFRAYSEIEGYLRRIMPSSSAS